MQYRKKNLTANISLSEADGKAGYIVTTQSVAKPFKTLAAAETYLLRKGYVKV